MTKEIPDAQKTIEDSEKCANNVALLQFEAEIWNALKYKGTERGELLHGAHKKYWRQRAIHRRRSRLTG